MEQSWMPAAIAFVAWLGALSLQFADLGTARFDSRRLARGARTVVRLHPVAWVVPVTAAVIVGLGVGLDYVSRLVVAGSTVAALLIALLLVVGLVAAWLVVTAAVTKPPADSYRAIRDELLDLAGTRVHQDWLDGLRVRLLALDREGDLGEALPAPSFGAAVGWVFRRPQRIVPPGFAVVLLVLSSIATAVGPAPAGTPAGEAIGGWAVVLAVVSVALSCVLAVSGARASLALVAAVRATQVEHRSDVEHLLAEAERSARKPVAGLGDRVTRALQILREQQG